MTKIKDGKIQPVRRFLVLNQKITNTRTGKSFLAGETITSSDFPSNVIENWLTIEPPVLEEIFREVIDGESREE